jgi:hypothetical protein
MRVPIKTLAGVESARKYLKHWQLRLAVARGAEPDGGGFKGRHARHLIRMCEKQVLEALDWAWEEQEKERQKVMDSGH